MIVEMSSLPAQELSLLWTIAKKQERAELPHVVWNIDNGLHDGGY